MYEKQILVYEPSTFSVFTSFMNDTVLPEVLLNMYTFFSWFTQEDTFGKTKVFPEANCPSLVYICGHDMQRTVYKVDIMEGYVHR